MRSWWGVFLVLVFAVRPALAGEGASADALFREGREAMRAGDLPLACMKFSESQRLDPAPGTLLNLAHCEEKLGMLTDAWDHYQTVLDQISRDDDRVDHVKKQLEQLDAILPRLTLSLPAGLSGARVSRDGVELGAAAIGVPLPINPGAHEIVLTAEGHEPRTFRIEIAKGEKKTLDLSPGEALTPPPAVAPKVEPPRKERPKPRRSATPTRDSRRSVGFVVGGIGIAGLVVGGTAGILALREKRTVKSHCSSDYACDATGLEAADDGKRWALVSTIGFAVGVSGIGVGTYLVLTARGPVVSGRF